MTAAEPGSPSAFQVGDIYATTGGYGQIAKITGGGATVINPWVTIPDAQQLWGNLWIDNTGVWGDNMIVATLQGDIWEVTPQGASTKIASVGDYVEGLTTVPNNPALYGPLAGTILVSVGDYGTDDKLYSINQAGQVTTYHLGFTNTESIEVIPANANFYGLDIGNKVLYGASASDFASMAGDLLVVQETPTAGTSGLYRLHWDGTKLDILPIPLMTGSSQPSQWEGTTFTPFSVSPLPPAPPTTIGLPNWPINLENSSGQVVASTVTDANGNYAFTNVAAGTYTVAEVQQDGWTEFAPAQGTYVVTVTSDQVVSGLDFGNSRNAPAPADPGPVFSSDPASYSTARVGQLYTYPALAADADHDQVTYSLSLAPAGMVIDSRLGTIDWTPTAGQVGFQNVDVQATDSNGVAASQYFTIAVSPADVPPQITSTPPSPAYAGLPYTYQVHAVSPENYPFTFSLGGTPPAGMSITLSGLLTWPSPTAPNPTVTIDVTDNQGGTGVPQVYTLQVAAAPGAGTITFQPPPPPSEIQLGRTYQYQAVATDTYNYTITYSATGTEPSGLTVNPGGLVTWDTTNAQLQTYTLSVKASDEYGDSTTQSFSVAVVSQQSDQPPTITSTPPRYAVVGDQYRYSLTATDPGGYPMTWTLNTAPAGMVLDASTNTLLWTPTADEVGFQPVSVTVADSNGGHAQQSFTIDTLAADLPPQISSEPPTLAGLNVPYSYQVLASDPDGSNLTYSVTANPANSNITIDSSGLLTWPNPTPLGTESITVTVSDFAGLSATQTYTLTVQSTAPGSPPVITSTPPSGAGVGSAYPYTVTATDPQNSTITYSISSSPALGDLSINQTTGVVSWTPTSQDAGLQQPISITVTATDGLGLSAYQTFPVTVVNSQPPTITGTPPDTITAGLTYIYQVQASDPAGDPLTYALQGQPSGMAIDSSGRITWPTTAANIPGSPYSFQVVVTNPYGLSVTSPSYPLSVTADTTAPTVQVQISSNPADINSTVYFDLIASDNVGVTSETLTVNGTPVALDANGRGQYFAGTLGLNLPVVATAQDAAGNVGTANDSLAVVDPTDSSAPVIAIATPSDQAVITSPVEVTGTVSDPNILSWTLDEAPLNSSTFTTIANGTAAVSAGGNLGLFDPTTLANGPYTLRLTAWNAGGHVSTTSITVNVSGYLKLGNLHLSFTDLTVPVSGIPITITRTYDSLNAGKSSDFGYGWTLSESNYQLKVDTLNSSLSSFGDTPPFVNGTRVIITKPDGTTEGFTFEPTAVTDSMGIVVEYYTPAFVPDQGVTDTLTVPAVDLELALGEYISGDGTAYNPANAEFGNTYTLTSYSGIASTFDATYGDLLTESDRHNNTLTFEPDGIFSNTGRQVTFVRDPAHQNRITSITDPNGNSIVYGYDPVTGDLTSVQDRDGNTVTLAYSAAQPHFLDQITDALGRVVLTGQYSTSGRLNQVTNATGASSKLTYNPDPTASTESATAPGNTNPTTMTFNSQGLVTKSVDADGNETDYTYSGLFLTSKTQYVGGQPLTTTYTNNAWGEPLIQTDPAGNTTHYAYDQYGDPTSQSDSLGDTTGFNYYFDPTNQSDPYNGDLLSTTDPLGNSTSFGYDSAGDVLSTTSAAGTTTNTYDPYGDLLTTTSPQNVTSTNTYDNNGNQKTSASTWVDPNNSQNTHTLSTSNIYDNNGNLKETDQYDNGVFQTSTSTTYNADGQAISSIDELGGVTTTVFDANGNVIQTTTPDGMITDTVYDAQGRAIYTDDPHRSGEPCDGTHTLYDQAGQVIGTERLANVVITITTAGGVSSGAFTSAGAVLSATFTSYDAAGRVVQSVDASGMITNNSYDSVGNLTETDQIVGGVTRTTTSTYDVLGRVTSSTDALGHTTQYQYNAAGQVTKTIFADGTSIVDKYDSQGRKIAEIDQNGIEIDYQYDQYGNLTAVILPNVVNPATGQSVNPTYHYAYDQYGNQVSTTDALGRQTTYAYDQYGHKVSETLPMTQKETWNYNSLSQLTSQTDFDGNVTNYAYDSLGRLATKTVYAYNNLTTPYETVTYAYNQNYDAQGDYHDTVTSSLTGTTDSEYDVNGNLIKITSPQGTVNYAYDLATGNKIEVWTTNTDIHYGYDQAGELTSVTVTKLDGQTLATPLVTTYGYNLDGLLVTTQNANGVVETRLYDALNRLVSIVDSGPSGVIASFAYAYDLAGHILSETDRSGRVDTYTYDNLYRLTQQSISDPSGPRTLTWTYDLVGNRVASTDNGAPTNQQSLTYVYNANDELTSITGTGGYGQTYTYDANGSTLTVTGSGGAASSTSTWTPTGMLATYTSGSTSVSYTYDDAGYRTSETVNGTPTTYLNDPLQAYDQVLEEYSNSGLAATFVRGINLILQDRGANGRSTYLTDNLGSARALTNSVGAITDAYIYDAYGNLLASTGTTTNEFRFAGMQLDPATGQYYDHARDYAAADGIFTSRDSYDGQAADPITENHYIYVGADPCNGVDPNGHFTAVDVMVSIGIGATVSGLDAALAGKSGSEIFQSAVVGGFLGAFGPAIGSVMYLRAVVGGASIALGIIGTYEAYLDGNFNLAAFRGVTSFASLALIVTAAAKNGSLRPLVPAGRFQVGRLASGLKIRATQSVFREPNNIDVYKAAMLEGDFRFESLEGRIGGYRTPDGTYYVGEGHHRMEAALEILAETGNRGPVDSLLRFGDWDPRRTPPAGDASWSALVNSLNPGALIVSPSWGSIVDALNSLL